ncbi:MULTISPECIES: type II toxin-antitoxin system VapC family toxin [Campylobacter]|uniref:type II toxin-antitoxin system VapC family toxin n=1 Tax=Campylobacter TaxID=194 RepID=UPI000CE49560|nr:PIN domain-containing protein [Campylobacter hyointestinalis]PPB51193.1 PIN domain-containing protein [Campylobacter hyointestinalis subsp. hyointestinalis]PPB65608.1 PIN domain-containing protein [Campylobacter hyointestinalis subsp. hyointestinalis]PPB68058.1 PIN domain-containing protein [Campylobacter hyointestinalis subsp. hyointestinalis]
MNKVFFDTNIIIDLMDAQRENNAYAVVLMKNLMRDKTQIVISEDCISTLYYNLRKSKEKQAALLDFLEVISQRWIIANFGVDTIKKAIKYSKNSNADLEDALQYFCADKEGCEAIYTTDKNFPKIAIAIKGYEDL